MLQQGQVLRLKSKGASGETLWAYRYRIGGRDSKRVQRGGFQSAQDAREALERELEVLRRVDGVGSSLTLAELVDEYLAQHDAEPVTIEKLRWLLAKAIASFGDRRLSELRPHEIAAWRMTIPPGARRPPRGRSVDVAALRPGSVQTRITSEAGEKLEARSRTRTDDPFLTMEARMGFRVL
jgi:hypothetical protein